MCKRFLFAIIFVVCISAIVANGVDEYVQGVSARTMVATIAETQSDNSDPDIKDLERQDEQEHEKESEDWNKNGWMKLK